jgi:hypothetical protein
MSPEQFAQLPPEVQQEMYRRMVGKLQRLGVRIAVTPDGQKVFNLNDMAAALGMSVDEAEAIAIEAGMDSTDRDDDLEALH